MLQNDITKAGWKTSVLDLGAFTHPLGTHAKDQQARAIIKSWSPVQDVMVMTHRLATLNTIAQGAAAALMVAIAGTQARIQIRIFAGSCPESMLQKKPQAAAPQTCLAQNL
jgi:hypothetical protein